MRAALEALDATRAALESSLRRSDARAERLEEKIVAWDRDIAYIMGQHSAFRVDPPTVRVRDVRDFRRMPLPDDMRAAMRYVRDVRSVSAAVAVVEMEKFLVQMHEEHLLDMRVYVRLKLEDDRREWRYCVSSQMFRQVGFTPRDAREFGMQIGLDLAHLASQVQPKKRANA